MSFKPLWGFERALLPCRCLDLIPGPWVGKRSGAARRALAFSGKFGFRRASCMCMLHVAHWVCGPLRGRRSVGGWSCTGPKCFIFNFVRSIIYHVGRHFWRHGIHGLEEQPAVERAYGMPSRAPWGRLASASLPRGVLRSGRDGRIREARSTLRCTLCRNFKFFMCAGTGRGSARPTRRRGGLRG